MDSLSKALPSHEPLLISLTDVASLPQKTRPQLYSDNTEDEEDKEAEEKDISKHGKSIQQQHHQNPHT